MAKAEKIFRKSSLDRLSSPEQLDRLVGITDPMGWLALGTLALMLFSVTLWGIFGRIPYNVTGQGMIISEGGSVYSAMAPSDGVVGEILVSVNQRVREGDDLVLIRQEALRETSRNAESRYQEKLAERRRMMEDQETELLLKLQNFAKQKSAQREIIDIATARKDYMANLLARREEALGSGLISKESVEDTRQEYNQVIQEISSANNRILELDERELDLQYQQTRQLAAVNRQLSELRRVADEIKSQVGRVSRVTAPADGIVTEIRVTETAVVQSGAALVSVASGGQRLQAIVYVPTADGKRVKSGMSVRVAPATVKKEEFGTLVGEIAEVSDFPATTEGMQATLQNSALVQRFSAQGAPYATRVDLLTDPETPSGYRWTSAAGPNLQITAGTTVEAAITVREVPPIVLILPFLQQMMN